jgi:hypothetical protein
MMMMKKKMKKKETPTLRGTICLGQIDNKRKRRIGAEMSHMYREGGAETDSVKHVREEIWEHRGYRVMKDPVPQ